MQATLFNFYTAVAAANPFAGAQALAQGGMDAEATAGLRLFGAALSTHSPESGGEFIYELTRGKEGVGRLAVIVGRRSSQQLARIAGSLRGDETSFHVRFGEPEPLLERVREILGPKKTVSPDSLVDQVATTIAQHDKIYRRHETASSLERIVIENLLFQIKEEMMGLFLEHLSASVDLLFNWMREPDPSDQLARYAISFSAFLAERTDYLWERLLQDWPPTVEGQSDFALAANLGGILALKSKEARTKQTILALRERHPGFQEYFDGLIARYFNK